MKPIDFRNANFERLREELDGVRAAVYRAWITDGPGTTRERAASSGIDLLTFRPRTTDLCHLGLVTLADEQPDGTEGIYRARRPDEWETWRAAQAEAQISGQMALI